MRGIYCVSLFSAKGNLQAGFKSVLTCSSYSKPESVAVALPQDCIPGV